MSHERPSRTAKKIARFMILIDSVPRFAGLLPADAAATVEQILRSSGAARPREIDAMRKPWVRRFYEITESALGKGQLLWFGVRKRWISECVESAIADGATQLLVVGAGFDPLAAIVAHRHPQVTCVEIDAPNTANPKREGLRGSGAARPNLHVCAADLSKRSLAEVLAETPWRTDARSVVAAEGLLMYLDALAVSEFLAAVRACTAHGSRLALTSVDADDQGHPHIATLDWPVRMALRLAGEPMRWGIRPAALPAFVELAGYRVLDQPDLEALRQRFLAPLGLRDEPVSPYEHVALLEVAPPASASD